jgi:hypothetical protein
MGFSLVLEGFSEGMEGLLLRLLAITGFSVVMGFSLVQEGLSEGMEGFSIVLDTYVCIWFSVGMEGFSVVLDTYVCSYKNIYGKVFVFSLRENCVFTK